MPGCVVLLGNSSVTSPSPLQAVWDNSMFLTCDDMYTIWLVVFSSLVRSRNTAQSSTIRSPFAATSRSVTFTSLLLFILSWSSICLPMMHVMAPVWMSVVEFHVGKRLLVWLYSELVLGALSVAALARVDCYPGTTADLAYVVGAGFHMVVHGYNGVCAW